MSYPQLSTPIVLILFKRPETTQKVFEAIRQARPQTLFVIADGPRRDRPDEYEQCLAARAVVDHVDWDVEIFKNYSDTNLGLKKRISSGLSWVFERVDRAIILEDDCVPDSSFFQFCEVILEQYSDHENIFSVTGHNHLGEWKSDIHSYFFSNYFDCWGWATWRRVWQKYDPAMLAWGQPTAREQVRQAIADDEQFLNRATVLESTYAGKIDSWAYPFFFMSLLHAGLHITPSVNLIQNTGFGENASNTINANDLRGQVIHHTLTFPLTPPDSVMADREHDYNRYKKVWRKPLKRRIINTLKKLTTLTCFRPSKKTQTDSLL